MRLQLWNLYLLSLLGVHAVASKQTTPRPEDFHPSSYPKKTAKCKAVNRKENKETQLEIKYVDINPEAEKTILMVHGWPGLWSNWGRQIQEFQDEYHIIAVDHRGFGESTHPGDVESSGNMGDLVGDLVCVLQDAGVDRAICVGHDWGSQVCWEAGRMRPDIIEAVAGAVVPYIPSSRWFFTPTWLLVWKFPSLAYQLYFQDRTVQAAEELNKDIRRTIRGAYRCPKSRPPPAFLKSKTDFLGVWNDIEIPPSSILTPEEEDYLVQQYSIQGFNNTLQFYTYGNKYASYKFSHSQGNYTIPQPALAIYPTHDAVANWDEVEKLLGSKKYLPNLTVEKTIPSAHWIQLERPAEFNAVLRKWLNSLPAKGTKEETTQQHRFDEL